MGLCVLGFCFGGNTSGRTALHIAVEKSKVPIVKALTKAGADLRARDSRGRTPMDLAEAQGHQEMVEALEQVSRGQAPAQEVLVGSLSVRV